MNNLRFIIITGIDGTGKSTLTNSLIQYLRFKGYKSKYVRIRYQHTIAYLISRILIFLGWFRTFRNPNGVLISRFEVLESIFSKKIWPIIEFISVLPLIIFKVKIPLLLGYRIVCDRYTIDTIVSIALHTRNMNFTDSFIGTLLFYLILSKVEPPRSK